MDRRFRRGFTAAEKTELWDRWQRAESLKAIGRAFGKPSSPIYCQVVPHGGLELLIIQTVRFHERRSLLKRRSL
jgi:hypothetical protein